MDTRITKAVTEFGRDAFRQEEWDQPPEVGYLVDYGDGTIHPVELVIPSQWWGLFPDTYDGLIALANLIANGGLGDSVLKVRNPLRVVGAIILTEAWRVHADPEHAAELKEQAAARQLHQHPDRRECRVVQAVTLDGDQLMMSYDRGTDPDAVEPITNGVDGRMFEALNAFLELSQGAIEYVDEGGRG